MSIRVECEDHTGKKFKSITEMCVYYNINAATFLTRIKNGCSLKDALTRETNRHTVKDFNGKEFNSITDLCRYYNQSCDVVKHRISNSWTLREALLIPVEHKRIPRKYSCMDHLGNTYVSKSQMCREYGISRTLFNYRIKNGWSLEDALTLHGGKDYIADVVDASA